MEQRDNMKLYYSIILVRLDKIKLLGSILKLIVSLNCNQIRIFQAIIILLFIWTQHLNPEFQCIFESYR